MNIKEIRMSDWVNGLQTGLRLIRELNSPVTRAMAAEAIGRQHLEGQLSGWVLAEVDARVQMERQRQQLPPNVTDLDRVRRQRLIQRSDPNEQI